MFNAYENTHILFSSRNVVYGNIDQIVLNVLTSNTGTYNNTEQWLEFHGLFILFM